MSKSLIGILICLVSLSSNGQENALNTICTDKITVYSDFGFASAPMSFVYQFDQEVEDLQYKNNLSPSFGLGFAYQWFNLRLNFALNNTKRAASRFGNTRHVDLGINFQIKQVYSELSVKAYNGYAITEAYEWNDTLNELRPNLILPNAGTFSFSLNTWVFNNKEFKMASVYGRSSYFSKSTKTWYVKPTINLFGVSNQGETLFPSQFHQSTKDISRITSMTAFELGLVPGYAQVIRYQDFQFSAFAGLGGVVQIKAYQTADNSRGFLGLAPRVDLRLTAGYYNTKYFLCLSSEIDNKSIRFQDLGMRQLHYSIRLTGGIRFNKKKKGQDEVSTL
jgi:hypothetical protein